MKTPWPRKKKLSKIEKDYLERTNRKIKKFLRFAEFCEEIPVHVEHGLKAAWQDVREKLRASRR